MSSFLVEHSIEIFVLIIDILLYVSLIASKTSNRFGVPVLLLFLLPDFAAGDDGLGVSIHCFYPHF
jgi:cell volume regulation protein A